PQAGASKCINVIASRLVAHEPESFKLGGITSFWTRFLEIAKKPLRTPEKGPLLEDVPHAYNPVQEKAGKQIFKEQDDETREPAVLHAGKVSAEAETSQKNAGMTDESVSADGADPRRKPLSSAPDTAAAQSSFKKMEFSTNLPTLPHILLKLIELCNREDANMKDLAGIIENDPSLSSKILRMVNSAYYGFSQKVHNFNQALSLLGIDTIRGIAISASVYQVFDGIKGNSLFKLKQFWWHSLMCAVLSNLIAKKISYARPDEAFLSGLLHDIGKLVLLKNFPDGYEAIIKAAENNAGMVVEEQEKLGITHCEAGAWLINHWLLQSFIADAIRYHHEPVSRIIHALPLVKIVYTANALCSATSVASAAQYETAEKVFSFTQADLAEIMKQAEEQVAQIAQSLDIDIEPPHEAGSVITEKDREIQQDLTNRVRDISLLQGTLQNFLNAGDVDAILQVAYRGFQALFDIKNVLFFLYDESQNILIGKSPPVSLHHDLTIPFQDDKSMLVAALRQARFISSFAHRSEYALTIIDEQLIRLMGKEGIVCFPMIVRKQYVGAVVLPLDTSGMAHTHEQMNLLQMFINQAALALESESTRQAQAKRVLTERVAASTAIVRKVAHEVNNPLSIIKNYLKIVELRLSEQNIPIDDLSIINEEIDRVVLIIDDLSDFSRPKIENLATLQLNDLLANLIKITRQSFLQNNIHIHFTPDASLPPLSSDKNGLMQVCINLIKNASEALMDGGNIFIGTKYVAALESVEIIIRDDGPGLPEAMKSRLFEPYTSTKGEGHAGLGLSVVYNTVQELRGSITFTTEEGKGTSFFITLPVDSSKNTMFRSQ
ncbi:MAG: HDOD domain-containing protein, partial [Pseudomonadota bacterium]